MDMDASFNSACRVLLQEEMGGLNGFSAFLSRYVAPIKRSKSIISGKEVCHSEQYCKKAKFISLEESTALNQKPIGINEIKDIDSLFYAVKENAVYSGNKVLGTSREFCDVDNCISSSSIYKSSEIFNSERIAYSQMIVNSKFMFGCSWGTENNFCINTTEMTKAFRAFEAACIMFCSDVFYCYNCKQCVEIMFSFNQHAKSHCIGNNLLEKGKYCQLKAKLVSELAQELKKRKTLPSIVEMSKGEFP